MFYEIRRYQTQPERRAEWVRYMEEVVVPFQSGLGMNVIASFIDEEDENGYLWIRRFEDEAERAELYRAVYENELWTGEIGPAVHALLLAEQSVVTRVVPTAASRLQ
ncbi:NIPSNAP family protein [Nocardia sp. NPDC004604]|uniref:NIPSNAP family protein n=1 Tax=Nocardia sp. NPDC004604 TaxID=3157013 RepID=UPI0033B6419E